MSPFESLVSLVFLPSRLRLFLPSNQFSVSRTLHQSCSPVCKDGPWFLNHLISLPQARDISVWRSCFACFFKKKITVDSAPQINFLLVGPFIKVVVLDVKMTLDFWITPFRYQKHVISPFEGLVSLVFLRKRLRLILPVKSIFCWSDPSSML